MVSASATEHDRTAKAGARGENRLSALARDLVDAVGVEGAIRYCSSLGWQGVLEEVEVLRLQRSLADRSV
jgi:hypothetical protein